MTNARKAEGQTYLATRAIPAKTAIATTAKTMRPIYERIDETLKVSRNRNYILSAILIE